MTYTKTVLLPVSPDEAFALITQPERLRRWQAVSARVDLRVTGEYRWTVSPGHIAVGTFQEIEPGKRLVFGWGWDGSPDQMPDTSTVTITMTAAPEGTEVTLRHDGLTPDQEVMHAQGWNHYLDRLMVAADEGDAGPDEWAAVPQPLDALTAADATLAVLQGVLRKLTDEDKVKQTPCADFDCHALAEHLFASLTGLGAMVGVEVENPKEGSLENRIAIMAAITLEGWRARGLDGLVPGPGGGEMPAATAAAILPLEFLIHAWDFAVASGQQVSVADELVAYVREIGEPLIDGGRGNAFGAEAPTGPDATALERLVAFSGRNPAAA